MRVEVAVRPNEPSGFRGRKDFLNPEPCFGIGLSLSLICQLTSEDIKQHFIITRKLSGNEQFFVGAQTVLSLLQTTQIKQGVSFTAANKVYTSTNKTTIV